ncbi:hypothetical protein AOXY_G131 [Acipenser oxyrinchus oxyrinchus]|uniref:BED-type domain-containing protein n=1 Tax=Acipenser oxyrinchus oxyrinchus TaxID=40147 RepID=A0AAD8GJN5_ACIOX|nr:hypothetical protein AOXY_G131 [Acipenser oxyrinchus oxyrinchus]
MLSHECPQGQMTALGNFNMKCKHCSKEVSGSCRTTSNFFTHMKRHHPDIHKELKQPVQTETAKMTSQLWSVFFLRPFNLCHVWKIQPSKLC